MIPIRCFTCGKPIGQLWDKYKTLLSKGVKPADALTQLGLTRYCCRAVFISHVELIDLTASYRKF